MTRTPLTWHSVVQAVSFWNSAPTNLATHCQTVAMATPARVLEVMELTRVAFEAAMAMQVTLNEQLPGDVWAHGISDNMAARVEEIATRVSELQNFTVESKQRIDTSMVMRASWETQSAACASDTATSSSSAARRAPSARRWLEESSSSVNPATVVSPLPPQLGTAPVTYGTCHAGDVVAGVFAAVPPAPLAEPAQQPPSRAPKAPPPEALPSAIIATLAIPDTTTVTQAVPVRPLPTGRTDPDYFMTQPRQRTIFHAPPLALGDIADRGGKGSDTPPGPVRVAGDWGTTSDTAPTHRGPPVFFRDGRPAGWKICMGDIPAHANVTMVRLLVPSRMTQTQKHEKHHRIVTQAWARFVCMFVDNV